MTPEEAKKVCQRWRNKDGYWGGSFPHIMQSVKDHHTYYGNRANLNVWVRFNAEKVLGRKIAKEEIDAMVNNFFGSLKDYKK